MKIGQVCWFTIIIWTLSVGLAQGASAQTRLFLDLSPAQTANATPTPNSAQSPVTTLEVSPGSVVRISVGLHFEPSSDCNRWYLLSAYLMVNPELAQVVAVGGNQTESNAFWHPDVQTRNLDARRKAAVSPQTPPLRENLLKPTDTDFPVFSSSGALWVVLAPGGRSQTETFFVGHCYLRVREDIRSGTRIRLALSSQSDPNRVTPNSLIATDSAQRYHLFGTDLPAQEAVIIVKHQAVVEANVELGDFIWGIDSVPVQMQIRQVGSTTPLREYNLLLQQGQPLVQTVDLTGTYDIAFKASHWLRKVVPLVSLSGSVTVWVELTNGDIDGDNEVTLFDFGQLVAAFGSMPGDSSWNPNADLDGDEEVTLFDFGVLVRNFGAIGDE